MYYEYHRKSVLKSKKVEVIILKKLMEFENNINALMNSAS